MQSSLRQSKCKNSCCQCREFEYTRVISLGMLYSLLQHHQGEASIPQTLTVYTVLTAYKLKAIASADSESTIIIEITSQIPSATDPLIVCKINV